MAKCEKHWKKYALLLSWSLLAVLPTAFSQQPFYYKYTLDDGLWNPEPVGVNIAQNGDLWTSYSSGDVLSRFDGINWTHYHLEEMGLPLRLIFFTETDDGTWFHDRADDEMNLACLTPKGEWKTYELDGFLFLVLSQSDDGLTLFGDDFYSWKFDGEKDHFVRSKKQVYIPIDKDREQFVGANNTLNDIPYLTTKDPAENLYRWHYGKGFQYSITMSTLEFQPIYKSGEIIKGPYKKNGQWEWWDGHQVRPISAKLPNGRAGQPTQIVYLKTRANKWAYLNGLVVEDPVDHVHYLCEIDSTGTARALFSHLPSDYSRSFSQDKHGHWWFSTSSGLVRTDQSQLVFDENTPGMVTGLHAIGEDGQGNTWMGGYTGQGGFTVFDGKQLKRQSLLNKALPVLPGTCRSESGTSYFFWESAKGVLAVRNGQLAYLDIGTDDSPVLGYYFHPLRNGKIALGMTGSGLGIATETDGLISSIRTIGKEKGMLLDNVLTVSEDEGGRLWCGRSSQGIALYDPQRDTAVTWLRSPESPGSIGAMSSCVDENGTLWLGGHNGLYRLERPHDFKYLNSAPTDFIEKVALPGRDTSTVAFLQNTAAYLVVGTQLGVYFLDKKYHGERPRIFSLKYGKEIHGSSSEQNAVLFDRKGFLWMGTQTGATRIDLGQLHFDTSATEIKLLSFQAADVNVGIEGGKIGEIPIGRRTIDFSFTPSGNPFFRDNLYFELAIVNTENDTLFRRFATREKKHRVDYLPPGDYTLRITAMKHSVISGHGVYGFSVPKTLNEKPWFWAALASAVLAVPLGWFYMKKRHQAEIEKAKREQDALKVQALSNFFNPHFINNALHWVQGKYRKDPDTATMIGRLADNVHILFKNTQSGKAYHPLEQELLIVKNYLRIQQVRFGGGLSAHFDLPETSSISDISIPAMLIQIHSENAVEQGIRNRKGAGNFSLSVRLEPDGCRIIIEDDGRGRPLMPEKKIVARKGSTVVMEDLVRLFNRYNPALLTVKYEDRIFKHETEVSFGTRVIVFIPKKFNYELSKTKGTRGRR